MKYLTILLITIFSCSLNAQTVRDFTLKDLENDNKSFSELKGERLTLIDFWATWCKPCIKGIPDLNLIYDTYKDRGVSFIGINCDGPRSVAKVKPVSKSLQIKYPVLLDINSDIKNELNLMAFPTLIIVNASGKIVWIHEGFVSGDSEEIIAEIEKLLKDN